MHVNLARKDPAGTVADDTLVDLAAVTVRLVVVDEGVIVDDDDDVDGSVR